MKPLRFWFLKLRPLFLGSRKANRRYPMIEWDLPDWPEEAAVKKRR